jgi:hypothetical protein
MIKDLLLTTKYERNVINYLQNKKIGQNVSNMIMYILEIPYKYFWRFIIKNEKSAKVSMYILMTLQAIAVLGVEYGLGLLANNSDMIYNGLYAHLGLDAITVTLVPSWVRCKAKIVRKGIING